MPAAARLRPMQARDVHQPHRVATSLELLFDLVTVIAVASAAAGLHHAIAGGHATDGVVRFAMAFFGIWWAWMNYTWFASAYDNDDVLFRLLTLAIMGGALAIASGIELFFKSLDLTMVVTGYVIMRVGMVVLWLRAALGDPARRTTALTYALGIALVQVYWAGLLWVHSSSSVRLTLLFALGAAFEIAVPALAERSGRTPWHRHHIIERYGLLNIIVLGETLLAGSLALRAVTGEHFQIALVRVALSSLVIVFSMWWLYFSKEEHLQSQDLGRSLTWGYGHVLIFAAGAAVGAGFAVVVDIVSGHAQVLLKVGNYAVAVPVALYLLGLWFVRDRFYFDGAARHVLPAFAALVLLVPLQPLALEGVAGLLAVSVFVRSRLTGREAARSKVRRAIG
jgi:low temperature requirement protein LtrA